MENSKNSQNYTPSQLGYFLSYELWEDALNLLNYQIERRKENRHYNTLSIFYYERAFKDCILYVKKDYFETKIASSLFYGLKKEFFVHHYVIPKKGLGLRDYVFFTYPTRALYYAVGLYLLKLSEEFLSEVHGKLNQVESFYGGKLCYKNKGKELELNQKNTFYRSYYEKFRSILEDEINHKNANKVILKLDIENYFCEIEIHLLLEKLDLFIKPSIKSKLKFDIFTKEQICILFDFLMHGKGGIPQSENNIISGFIGHLFMTVGDFLIDDLLESYRNRIEEHKIIRYVDDIHISILFKDTLSLEEQEEFTLSIASEISETLYRELNLRLNLKTRAYHLRDLNDGKELLARIKTFISQDNAGFDYDEIQEEQNSKSTEKSLPSNFHAQEKLNKIFEELEKLKNSNVEKYFIRSNELNASLVSEEAFREILDKSVRNILGKVENIERMREIFDNFNFDLIKVKPFELIIMISQDKNTALKLREFLICKDSITTSDADLIIKYLGQKEFKDEELFKKLANNVLFRDIVYWFLNPARECEMPGYYNLSCMMIRYISQMPEVIEQMRMRVVNERNQAYSVALNHLVNEVHAICMRQDPNRNLKKDYKANDVFNFLVLKKIPCNIRIKIRNLFDRRNNNNVSHPGSDDSVAWEVTKEEYFEYYRYVGDCLSSLLLAQN